MNFEAGSLKRAPGLLQRIGLEWLWRIKEEPALWKRYGKDGMAFLRLFAFGVVPQAVRLAWLRRRHGAQKAPVLTETASADGVEFALEGAFVDSNLADLRSRAAQALEDGRHMTLEMSRVGSIGPEFLGFVSCGCASWHESWD